MKICVLGYRVSEVADVVAFLLVVVDTADRAHDVALAVRQPLQLFNGIHRMQRIHIKFEIILTLKLFPEKNGIF